MTNRENPCAGLIVCESCLAILSEEDTEPYTENHGPGHLETLSRTLCCKAAYTDLDEQQIVDELGRIQASTHSLHWSDGEIREHPSLGQTTRNNIEQIQIILEGVFEL